VKQIVAQKRSEPPRRPSQRRSPPSGHACLGSCSSVINAGLMVLGGSEPARSRRAALRTVHSADFCEGKRTRQRHWSLLADMVWQRPFLGKILHMGGYKKFMEALTAVILQDLREVQKDEKKASVLNQRANKYLFGDGPEALELDVTARERYIGDLFSHFSEVSVASMTLKDIEFYIRRFPYDVSKISKHRHLQFLVEAYLNEIYILEQRLLTFLTFIERQHKGDPRLTQIKATCKALRKDVQASFKELVGTRGSHVHEARYSARRLNRLAAFEVLGLPDASDRDEGKMATGMRARYNSEYWKARTYFREWVRKINARMGALLDVYFQTLFPLVFHPDNTASYPSRLK
jgi:hypothetical protein